MKVQCPSCKKICHETNDKYDPDVRPNGSMVDLLEPWKSYGWGKFGGDHYGGSSVMASDMLCPACQAQLAPKGRLNVIEQEGIAVEINDQAGEPIDEPKSPLTHTCEICGWEGKSKRALGSHHGRMHRRAEANA